MGTQSRHITLNNGVRIPIIGLGTSHHGGYSHKTVIFALQNAGYTHIDTAMRYGSEEYIGKDIKASGISREKLFITTKLWPGYYGYEETKKACMSSLAALDLEYIDLYLMHWPGCPSWFQSKKQCRQETWKAMEELYQSGKCKAIGVSNFLLEHLEEMLTYCSIKPHLNQIEFHPYCYPKQLIDFCKENKIVVGGYGPLAKAEIIKDKKLRLPLEPIASYHKKTIAQILIRWCIQHNVVVIPKSVKVERILENIDVFDFELTPNEMMLIDGLSDIAYIKSTWDPAEVGLYERLISSRFANKIYNIDDDNVCNNSDS